MTAREPKHWRTAPLPDEAWRSPPGLTPAQRRAEQDLAAGGPDKRRVLNDDGRTFTGSVALRRYAQGRKAWAYLRYSVDGTTRERYLGEASENSRAANLAVAWARAHDRGYTG